MENYFSEIESSTLSTPTALEQPAKLKFSGLGIASFVLSLVSLIGYIACTVIIGLLVADYNSGSSLDIDTATDAQLMPIGFAAIVYVFFILLNVAGLVLGIIGLALKNRRKVFAIIGTIINSLMILGPVLFVIIIATLQ